MLHVRADVDSLEEQVLRVLYEGPKSAGECAAALAPYARLSADRLLQIESLLGALARGAYLTVESGPAATRYALAPAGNERLAQLVE